MSLFSAPCVTVRRSHVFLALLEFSHCFLRRPATSVLVCLLLLSIVVCRPPLAVPSPLELGPMCRGLKSRNSSKVDRRINLSCFGIGTCRRCLIMFLVGLDMLTAFLSASHSPPIRPQKSPLKTHLKGSCPPCARPAARPPRFSSNRTLAGLLPHRRGVLLPSLPDSAEGVLRALPGRSSNNNVTAVVAAHFRQPRCRRREHKHQRGQGRGRRAAQPQDEQVRGRRVRSRGLAGACTQSMRGALASFFFLLACLLSLERKYERCFAFSFCGCSIERRRGEGSSPWCLFLQETPRDGGGGGGGEEYSDCISCGRRGGERETERGRRHGDFFYHKFFVCVCVLVVDVDFRGI